MRFFICVQEQFPQPAAACMRYHSGPCIPAHHSHRHLRLVSEKYATESTSLSRLEASPVVLIWGQPAVCATRQNPLYTLRSRGFVSGPCTIEFFTGLSRDVIPLTDGHQLSRSPSLYALIYTQIGRFRESTMNHWILLTNKATDTLTHERNPILLGLDV